MAEEKNTDTKKTEEKALNYLKTFIEDSSVISQFISDNDKEPCWDGHLYLYSGGKRDKEHLLGRVPVQVKGTEVSKFQTKKWRFKLEKEDLKAYLHEPTFFIVCQVKKDSRERKLFYRELLPNTIKNLLRDMDKQKSKSTLFHLLTEDLKEFEGKLLTFMRNSKKMISFADSKPFTMQDAAKKGIKDFSFTAPVASNDNMALLKYLTTHDTYLYAKLDKDLDIEVPIDGGPMKITFSKKVDRCVSVGERIFYNEYENTIEDGRNIIKIADVMTLNMPLDVKDKRKPEVKMTTKAKFLSNAIHEAEFAIAIYDAGKLTIDDLELEIKVNKSDYIDKLRERLKVLKELQEVLDKLHVSKPFDLSGITDDQSRWIDILISTVGKGETVNLPNQESTLFVMEISNVKLLLWCAANTEGVCKFGDFFDKSIRLSYKKSETECIDASPFSYLQNDTLWERCDNINYDDVINSAIAVCNQNKQGYVMANYDVLAIIQAADALQNTDSDKWSKLLECAYNLTEWLINNDIHSELIPAHICNKLQIIKRQRELSESEISQLETMYQDGSVSKFIKAGVLLLLDKQDEFSKLFGVLSNEERDILQGFPIWKFRKKHDNPL